MSKLLQLLTGTGTLIEQAPVTKPTCTIIRECVCVLGVEKFRGDGGAEEELEGGIVHGVGIVCGKTWICPGRPDKPAMGWLSRTSIDTSLRC